MGGGSITVRSWLISNTGTWNRLYGGVFTPAVIHFSLHDVDMFHLHVVLYEYYTSNRSQILQSFVSPRHRALTNAYEIVHEADSGGAHVDLNVRHNIV